MWNVKKFLFACALWLAAATPAVIPWLTSTSPAYAVTCVFGADNGSGQCLGFLSPGTTTWTVPSDWTSTNSFRVVGAGAGGPGAINSGGGSIIGGAGGGAYSAITNVSAATLGGVGNTVGVAVGAAGIGGTNGANAAASVGTAGGDTYLCNSTSNCASIAGSAVQVGAKGGGVSTTATAGQGGAAASGVGTVKNSGGNGGAGGNFNTAGAGGGGAAGPQGNGGAGGDNVGGTLGGAGGGGAGGGGSGTNGSAGGNAGVTSGAGGNNAAGAGGAAGVGSATPGNAGTAGGGGSGGGGSSTTANPGGAGGSTTDFDATHGVGGGGGAGGTAAGTGAGGAGAAGGNCGGGGGGGSGASGAGTFGNGGNGGIGCLAILYTPAASAGSPRTRLALTGAGGVPTAGVVCCTIDGTPAGGNFTRTTSGTATLTTSLTNDIIVVVIATGDAASTQTVSSVASANVTYAKRKDFAVTTNGGQKLNLEVWWGLATSALTSEVITVTVSGSLGTNTIIAFGVNGSSNTAAPWDTNVALPATGSDVTGVTTQPTVTGISTTAAATMLLSFMAEARATAQTAGTGYTLVKTQTNAGGLVSDTTSAAEQKTVSTTQSGVSSTFGTNIDNWSMIADAIR